MMEFGNPANKLVQKNGSTVKFPHDDPLLIMTRIRSWDVKRVLINDGSNADVLFSHLLPNLGISKGDLKPVTSPTFGIGPSKLPILRLIDLPLKLRGNLV